MRSRAWNKLGGKFFLMPDPRMVSFSEGILVGFKDGSAWGQDEYGRRTGDDASAKLQRAKEWVSYQKSVAAWDAKFGRLPAEKLRRHFVPMAGPKRARASGGATQVVEQPRKQVQNGPPAPEAVASMLDNPT